ncbi:MAG TPA: putative baseplate assembly protein [Acidimicrobiales bacterium]|jgi:predicted phage baseplate assembly protein
MPLSGPDLDDRRFQDLVDDAKRLVQQHCPEWTDHNVSDPGVTLIEAFAYMVDQLLYRLNRVPDRNYVKFLELLGVQLFPPTAARADVTFWLSSPQETVVPVPTGVVVATPRGEAAQSAILFSCSEPLDIVPCSLASVATQGVDHEWRDHTSEIRVTPIRAFSMQPEIDEVLLIGLSAATPRCAVMIRMQCEIEGVGVDPEDPPLAWEAFDGENWAACEVERDTTGGMNRAGDVVIHVPASHTTSLIHGVRAGWIRARTVRPLDEQPFYSNSPLIRSVEAFTVGGTTEVVQAEVIDDEIIGLSEGVPGQGFLLSKAPLVPAPGNDTMLEVAQEDGWVPWTQVDNFSASAAGDRHFVLDAVSGQIQLGPAVRMPDGSLINFGAVPPKGAVLRVRQYLSGGGVRGNVSAGSISVLRTTLPFVGRVQNRSMASGGVDGESIEEAKIRGPVMLRTLGRAVTAEDYERLAHEAAPDAARVRAVTNETPTDASGVRVLVVPAVGDHEAGHLGFEDLIPPVGLLQRIADYLDTRRTLGARVMVEPPAYQGVTVVAEVRARSWADPARVQAAAIAALFDYLHPISGGPDGIGWPFGRPVQIGEIHAVLQSVPGTDIVDSVLLFAADPVTGERGPVTERVIVPENALVYSYEHQVRVEVA